MSKRYGKPSPKIADKGQIGSEHKDTKPVEKADSKPEGTVTSGTDGAETKEKPVEQPKGDTAGDTEKSSTPEERHTNERKEMMDRHGKEMASMHDRHLDEHKKMTKRHHEEHTAALPESMAGTNSAVEGE